MTDEACVRRGKPCISFYQLGNLCDRKLTHSVHRLPAAWAGEAATTVASWGRVCGVRKQHAVDLNLCVSIQHASSKRFQDPTSERSVNAYLSLSPRRQTRHIHISRDIHVGLQQQAPICTETQTPKRVNSGIKVSLYASAQERRGRVEIELDAEFSGDGVQRSEEGIDDWGDGRSHGSEEGVDGSEGAEGRAEEVALAQERQRERGGEDEVGESQEGENEVELLLSRATFQTFRETQRDRVRPTERHADYKGITSETLTGSARPDKSAHVAEHTAGRLLNLPLIVCPPVSPPPLFMRETKHQRFAPRSKSDKCERQVRTQDSPLY